MLTVNNFGVPWHQNQEAPVSILPQEQPTAKSIPAPTLHEGFVKSLYSRSLSVADKPDNSLSVRLFDLRQALLTANTRAQYWTSELHPLLDKYYNEREQELPKIVCLPEGSQEARLVMKMARSVMDFRTSASMLVALGAKLEEVLSQAVGNLSDCKEPMSVQDQPNLISRKLGKTQYTAMYELLIKMGFDKTDVGRRKLKDMCHFTDTVPCRNKEFMALDWMRIARRVLTEMSRESGLNIEFENTPFFIGFIPSDIADLIAKETLFFDHPGSGHLLHGCLPHALQTLKTAGDAKVTKQVVAELISLGRWSEAFDLNSGAICRPVQFSASEAEQGFMVNHEPLIDGRYPVSFQRLLCWGLYSELLSSGLGSEDAALNTLKKFGLTTDVRGSSISLLESCIEKVRITEYLCAALTFQLGDFTAKAMATEKGNLEDLYTLEADYRWGRFDNDDLTEEMVRYTVIAYLNDGSHYDVYQAGNGKLIKIERAAEVIDGVGYVVYPKDVRPPDALL